MPIGPNGEKRPVSPSANAIHVAKILTKEEQETYLHKETQDDFKDNGRKIRRSRKGTSQVTPSSGQR